LQINIVGSHESSIILSLPRLDSAREEDVAPFVVVVVVAAAVAAVVVVVVVSGLIQGLGELIIGEFII